MKIHLAIASCLLAANLASAATNTANAADAWPARPVKVIVGFTPGGPTDLVARLVAQQLTVQSPSVPAKTVKELVDWIRANPGKESYASPGTGTPPQLTGALFVHALNLDLVHVPFNGGGSAVEATVGNHTPISFGAMAPAVPLIKNGDLRALAVTGKTRSPTLPDVPTMAEAGFPDVEGATWTAVVAPAGTPKDIVAKLHAIIVAGLGQDDVKDKLTAMAYVPIGSTPEECTAFFKAEMAKWSKVIKDAGLKAE
jgi:tripartite-type tricarboxylate transporter receptor subunit TctC